MEFGGIASHERRRVTASNEFTHWLDQVSADTTYTPHPKADPYVTGISVSADGSTCALLYTNQIEIFDIAEGRRICSFARAALPLPIHDLAIRVIELSPDGSRLAVIKARPGIEIWDTKEGKLMAQASLRWSYGAAWLGDEAIALLDPYVGYEVVSIMSVPLPHADNRPLKPPLFTSLSDRDSEIRTARLYTPRSFTASPGGQVIAASSVKAELVIFAASSLQVRYSLEHAPSYDGTSLAVADDGRTVAMGQTNLWYNGYFRELPQYAVNIIDMPSGAVRPFWPHRDKTMHGAMN